MRSTQTLQRDRHAYYIATLGLIATSIEKFAVEVRGLQKTETREVEEAFGKGQKGSSAMPHKRNPIGSENVTGLSRVIRGYITTAYENVPLWHERDISHSNIIDMIDKGLVREEAYDLVQPKAMESWETKVPFRELVQDDARIRELLTPEELEECFDENHILVVNKEISLPADYNPGLQPEVIEAYQQMFRDGAERGLDFVLVSDFRTYQYQVRMDEGCGP